MKPLRLTVARSRTEYLAACRCLAYLAPAALAALDLPAGALLVLTSARGRRILARAAIIPPADDGAPPDPGTIMLDRLLRRSLRARLGEPLAVEPLDCPMPVRRVVLAPAVDVTGAHHLEEHLRGVLVENATPVAEGMELFATFHHSTGGTTYTVVRVEGGPGACDAGTEVELKYTVVHSPEPETSYDDIGGLGREIATLREMVQLPLTQPHLFRQLGIKPPRGVILHGPPGVGKTLLMRSVAGEVNARFYYVNGPDILGSFYGEGESNLRKLFDEAAHHAPSILFFDELDAIAPKRGTSGAHADTRLVSQLLALLDGMQQVDSVMAIATTNRVDSLDSALRRPGRFDREIYVGPPTPAGRLEILQIHTREMPLGTGMEAALPWLAEQTHGFVGADLMELCRCAGLNALRRQLGPEGSMDGSRLSVEKADFHAALTQVYPSALREALVTIPAVTWADVGGLDETRQRLAELVGEALGGGPAGPAAGQDAILLHGPPGNGKTLVAHALARESGVNLIELDGPEVFTSWVGESEEYIRHAFRLARQLAPCLIFIDQLDAMAGRRGADQSSRVTERVVAQLLAEIDASRLTPGVVVLGATNRPDLIDPALLRPGRFGAHLHIPLPDAAQRAAILSVHTRDWELPGARGTLTELADAAAGLSAAALAAVCRQARRLAVRRSGGSAAPEVTGADLHAALALFEADRATLAM